MKTVYSEGLIKNGNVNTEIMYNNVEKITHIVVSVPIQ